ncbi:MAG: hypothetical protein ACKO3B_11305, partial [Bacteroidota bacterium]
MIKRPLWWMILLALAACSKTTPEQKPTVGIQDSTALTVTETPDTIITPVVGYRFTITGDFNGDGRQEKLQEHFLSRKTGQETNKFYLGLAYDEFVHLNGEKHPLTIMTSDDTLIDTLIISDSKQSLGLAWVKNEGDLNGDGGDEVSFVGYYADWSATNSAHVMTYTGGKWVEVLDFNVRDWMVPELPGTYTDFSMFGATGPNAVAMNDSINRLLEH